MVDLYPHVHGGPQTCCRHSSAYMIISEPLQTVPIVTGLPRGPRVCRFSSNLILKSTSKRA
eukprot:5342707-Lingulodinium_polyedra.AAC.1